MKYRAFLSVRLCALLLLLSIVWVICGAPVTSDQWQAVPLTLRRIVVQLSPRMQLIFSHWFSADASLVRQASAETRQVDLILSIWDSDAQTAVSLSLEDYVAGVVAAEMPAGYHPEALKSQAVAARTRAVYACRSLGGNGCSAHPECDVCTDSGCCQGYLSLEARASRWAGEFTALDNRVRAAVAATAGQIITYEGLPIQVLYHASSGGMTEDSAAVFAQELPYLTSVASPGEEYSSAYSADTTYSLVEACMLLEAAFPGCNVSPDGLAGQLRLQSSTGSGRIDTILVGSQTVTGRAFREALSLRSSLVTWDFDEDTIIFHTLGYGHGVGMSQAGAQAMAASGSGYADILAHYYSGTQLSLLPYLHD